MTFCLEGNIVVVKTVSWGCEGFKIELCGSSRGICGDILVKMTM